MFCFSAFQEETMCIEVVDFQFETPYKERHKVHIVKSRKSHTCPAYLQNTSCNGCLIVCWLLNITGLQKLKVVELMTDTKQISPTRIARICQILSQLYTILRQIQKVSWFRLQRKVKYSKEMTRKVVSYLD